MRRSAVLFTRFSSRMSILSVVFAVGATVLSGTTCRSAIAGGGEADEQAALFAAMDAGQIETEFIPISAARANLIVKNLTDKPLRIQMPATFAGVPVQAQMMGGMGGGGMGGMGGGGMGGGMGGMGGGMGGGGGQSMGGGGGMGGGMGGMGGGMGGMGGGGMGGMGGGGMGGGMFTVKPGRVHKMALDTVCLEHGKPDPTPRMKYAIVPLDQVTSDPAVALLCHAVGSGQVAQNTAQAAAWNLMDGLSWSELAEKNRVENSYSGNIPYFSQLELQAARAVVAEAQRATAEESPSNTSRSSESESSSSVSSDHVSS